MDEESELLVLLHSFSYEASKPVFVGVGGSAMINDPALAEKVRADYAIYSEPSLFGQSQLAAMMVAHRVAYRPSTYWKVRSVFRAVSKLGSDSRELQQDSATSRGRRLIFSTRMGRTQVTILERALRKLDENTGTDEVSQPHTVLASAALESSTFPSPRTPIRFTAGTAGCRRTRGSHRRRKARQGRARRFSMRRRFIHSRGDALRTVSYEPGSCPNAEWLSDRIVSLPTGRQVDQRKSRVRWIM
jgi:dTDP-4-amino-4,6-dideoxygalactose transaminase